MEIAYESEDTIKIVFEPNGLDDVEFFKKLYEKRNKFFHNDEDNKRFTKWYENVLSKTRVKSNVESQQTRSQKNETISIDLESFTPDFFDFVIKNPELFMDTDFGKYLSILAIDIMKTKEELGIDQEETKNLEVSEESVLDAGNAELFKVQENNVENDKSENDFSVAMRLQDDKDVIGMAILFTEEGEAVALESEDLSMFGNVVENVSTSLKTREEMNVKLGESLAFNRLAQKYPNTNSGLIVLAGKKQDGKHIVHVATLGSDGNKVIEDPGIEIDMVFGKGTNKRTYTLFIPQNKIMLNGEVIVDNGEVKDPSKMKDLDNVDYPNKDQILHKADFGIKKLNLSEISTNEEPKESEESKFVKKEEEKKQKSDDDLQINLG